MPIDPDELLKGIEDPAERRYRLAEAVAKERGITTTEAMPTAESYLQNVKSGLISEREFKKEPGLFTRMGEGLQQKAAAGGEAFERIGTGVEEIITGKQSERTVAEKKAADEAYLQKLLAEQAPTQEGVTTFGAEGQPGGEQAVEQPGGGGFSFKMPGIPGTGAIKSLRKELGTLQGEMGKTYESASKRYGQMAGESIAASEAVMGAELAANETQSVVMKDAVAKQLEFAGGLADVENRRKEYVGQQMGKLNTAITRFQQMKLDPQRLFKNSDGSTNYPRKVTAVLSVFLAGLGEQMQGRAGNPALDVIDRAIDRDIGAQQSDIQKAGQGIGIQFNVLGTMRQLFDDEKSAVLGAKAIAWQHANMELQQRALETGSPIIRAKIEQGIAQIQEKVVGIQTELEMNENANAAKMLGMEAGLATTEAQLGMQRAQLRTQQMGMRAKAAAGTGRPAFPGARVLSPEYAPTKEDEKAAKPMVAAHREASKMLNDLIEWRSDFGQEKLDRGALAVANTKLQRLKSAMRKVDETGARLDAGEIEMMGLDFGMGDLGFIVDRLTTVRDSVRDKVASRIYVRGYVLEDQPVEGVREID